jgi:hypothetical protein
MAKLPVHWGLVMNTVEGRQNDSSCDYQDGRFSMNLSPTRRKGGPNPDLLSRLLRSDETFPAEARMWLADMLDSRGNSVSKIQISKRGKGALPKIAGANWGAAIFMAEQILDNTNYATAFYETRKRFNISKRALEEASASYKIAHEENEELWFELHGTLRKRADAIE